MWERGNNGRLFDIACIDFHYFEAWVLSDPRAGDCDWDEEHGIMMVWLQGNTLTRVGPEDGDLGDYTKEEEAAETSTIYL